MTTIPPKQPITGDTLEEFMSCYYRGAGARDTAARLRRDVRGAAESHWQLMRCRPPGTDHVRAFVPTLDRCGWISPHTVVEIVTDDVQFLVEAVTMALVGLGADVHRVLHPVLHVRRDARGELLEITEAATEDASSESAIQLEIESEAAPETVVDRVRWAIGQARAVQVDRDRMRQLALDLAGSLELSRRAAETDIAEAAALLRWMADGNFLFLGTFDERGDGERLGVLRDGTNPRLLADLAATDDVVHVTKGNGRSIVHEATYVDQITVAASEGEVPRTCVSFAGLYTRAAERAELADIPIIRRKVEAVLNGLAFPLGGHADRRLVDLLGGLPLEELFAISVEELSAIALECAATDDPHVIRVFCRYDSGGRFAACTVVLPQDRATPAALSGVASLLCEALGGREAGIARRPSLGPLTALVVTVHGGADPIRRVASDVVERRVRRIIKSWGEELAEQLAERFGPATGQLLNERYGRAFDEAYRLETGPADAVDDIVAIEGFTPASPLAVAFTGDDECAARCRVLRHGEPLVLSGTVRPLEHLGLEVTAQHPYEVRPVDGKPVFVSQLTVRLTGPGHPLTDPALAERVTDLLVRVWDGRSEDDGLNVLAVRSDLVWREITLLRAIARYLRQAGLSFSDRYVHGALATHGHLARRLVEFFRARFEPSLADPSRAAQVRTALDAEIDDVASLDHDRILRAFADVIDAMVRTSYFQSDGSGAAKPAVAFKIESDRLALLPRPRPLFEVFVHGPDVEGIHMRGGRIARGGVRWSERSEDFRVEVLDLVKAQMAKNALIVPVGAKGGFVTRRMEGAEASVVMAQVRSRYEMFIGALLDLTDNVVGAHPVPPANTVCYDGHDAYLVVAPDKGTAALSDKANALALERSFWLGDAFASGGSAGYDHKAMGITARSAWGAVEQHLRELGVDPATAPLTAIGIGDMSGDVFGNGMLLAPQLRLVAAFDHRHVFLDPDPDPASSLAERRRLFARDASSWADYDRSCISAGGGVWPRSVKRIMLGPEAARSLGCAEGPMTPDEVIGAIIRAPVDVLWNGGVGTFVKATGESHERAGDRANDALRADASELRCRVVGEGGNLGLTHAARMEFTRAGGRVNTDAIDNAGGVSCSDLEVNIKILLDAACADGQLSGRDRDKLLRAMTDDVARLVLRDCARQRLGLSLSELDATLNVHVHRRLVDELEGSGVLEREVLGLPSDREFAERAAAQGGLARPELALLLATVKTDLVDALLASSLPDEPELAIELDRYFPDVLGERFSDGVRRHRLRREIIATRIAGELVDRAGESFITCIQGEIPASAAEVVTAYRTARDALRLPALWDELETRSHHAAAGREGELLLLTRRVLEQAVRWLLRYPVEPSDAWAQQVRDLSGRLPKLLAAGSADGEVNTAELLGWLPLCFDMVDIARVTGAALESVVRAYGLVGSAFELPALRALLAGGVGEERWHRAARAAMGLTLQDTYRGIVRRVLEHGEGAVEARLMALLDEREAQAGRYQAMLRRAQEGPADLAVLTVALRELAAVAPTLRL